MQVCLKSVRGEKSKESIRLDIRIFREIVRNASGAWQIKADNAEEEGIKNLIQWI